MTPERERKLRAEIRIAIAGRLDVPVEMATDEADIVNSLKADSLDAIELTMEIEDRFGISIPDEEAGELRTVGDIIACVIQKLKEKEKEVRGDDAPPAEAPR